MPSIFTQTSFIVTLSVAIPFIVLGFLLPIIMWLLRPRQSLPRSHSVLVRHSSIPQPFIEKRRISSPMGLRPHGRKSDEAVVTYAGVGKKGELLEVVVKLGSDEVGIEKSEGLVGLSRRSQGAEGDVAISLASDPVSSRLNTDDSMEDLRSISSHSAYSKDASSAHEESELNSSLPPVEARHRRSSSGFSHSSLGAWSLVSTIRRSFASQRPAEAEDLAEKGEYDSMSSETREKVAKRVRFSFAPWRRSLEETSGFLSRRWRRSSPSPPPLEPPSSDARPSKSSLSPPKPKLSIPFPRSSLTLTRFTGSCTPTPIEQLASMNRAITSSKPPVLELEVEPFEMSYRATRREAKQKLGLSLTSLATTSRGSSSSRPASGWAENREGPPVPAIPAWLEVRREFKVSEASKYSTDADQQDAVDETETTFVPAQSDQEESKSERRHTLDLAQLLPRTASHLSSMDRPKSAMPFMTTFDLPPSFGRRTKLSSASRHSLDLSKHSRQQSSDLEVVQRFSTSSFESTSTTVSAQHDHHEEAMSKLTVPNTATMGRRNSLGLSIDLERARSIVLQSRFSPRLSACSTPSSIITPTSSSTLMPSSRSLTPISAGTITPRLATEKINSPLRIQIPTERAKNIPSLPVPPPRSALRPRPRPMTFQPYSSPIPVRQQRRATISIDSLAAMGTKTDARVLAYLERKGTSEISRPGSSSSDEQIFAFAQGSRSEAHGGVAEAEADMDIEESLADQQDSFSTRL